VVAAAREVRPGALRMLFDSFDRIRIVNLAHRTDRRREMLQQLAGVGLAGDPRVAFFAAHAFADQGRFYSLGARGCFSSQMTLVEEAAAAGESLLILEDDCDFGAAIDACRVPAGCDVFYGGYLATSQPHDPAASDIVGAHCMGFSARCLVRLAPWLRAAWAGDDPAPIDGEYVRFRRANPDLVSVFAAPQVAFQRPSRTDIGQVRAFDRIPLLREAAGLARRFRRAR
jgi:hypothetical protein